MSNRRSYAWTRQDENSGHSFALVAEGPEIWTYRGTELLAGPVALSCTFVVEVDRAEHPRRARVQAHDVDGTGEIAIEVDHGRWLIDGGHVPELDGVMDIDIAATPLTNTFPIRRLTELAPGESSTFPVAWVSVPDLAVSRVEQTYTRLEPVDGQEAWEYRDEEHGRFTLTVDGDGIVIDYAGFARRVGAW